MGVKLLRDGRKHLAATLGNLSVGVNSVPYLNGCYESQKTNKP